VKEYGKYSMAKEITATLIITTDLADSWSKIPLGLDYTTYSSTQEPNMKITNCKQFL